MMMMIMHYYFYFLFERGDVSTIFGFAKGAGRQAEWRLYLQKSVFLSCSFAFFSAGNIPSERVLTEEDWAVDEVTSPYEKSKSRAEKTAWELVKNLPGEQQENVFVIDAVPSLLLNVNKGSARNMLEGGEMLYGLPQPTRNCSLTAYKRLLRTSRFLSFADLSRRRPSWRCCVISLLSHFR